MKHNIAYTDIVPDYYQNKLIQRRTQATADAFEDGDIANHVFYQAMKSGMPVTRDLCYAACAWFRGVKKRTMRYYADVALAFPAGVCAECGEDLKDPPKGEKCPPDHWCPGCANYSEDVREKYEGLLSFSHYAFVMRFIGKEEIDWREVLKHAAYGAPGGGVLSVDALESEYFPDPEPPQPYDVPARQFDQSIGTLKDGYMNVPQSLRVGVPEPEGAVKVLDVPADISNPWDVLRNLISIVRMCMSEGVPAGVRARVLQACELLEDARKELEAVRD